MKVEIIRKGLLIAPETDFEAEYLRKFYTPNSLKAFLKHGVSVATVLGVQVEFPSEELYTVELEEDDLKVDANGDKIFELEETE